MKMNYCQMWRSKLFSQCTIQVWITRGLLTCQCTFSSWHLVSNKDEFFVSCQNVFHTLPFQAWRYLTQKDRLNFSCHLLIKERTLTLKTMLSQTQCVILLIMFDPFRILQHKNFMTQSLLILFAPIFVPYVYFGLRKPREIQLCSRLTLHGNPRMSVWRMLITNGTCAISGLS